MIDYEDDYASDYKGRDIKVAQEEAQQMVDTILTPPDMTPLEVREEIARKTVRNFRDHINRGFLEYRKSVTEATNFAMTEWTGEGSVLVDALDRQFLDVLGGFLGLGFFGRLSARGVRQRLGRPVVVPYSAPRSRSRSPVASRSSVGSGPSPTRVV